MKKLFLNCTPSGIVKQWQKLSVLNLLILLLSATLFSCSDDDDSSFNDNGSTVELPSSRVFILNEGSYQANNSNISFYAPNGEIKPIANLYYKQNNAGLGDTGQDLIVYDNNLYLSVTGSMYLQKLNSACVIDKTVQFTESDGAPRGLVAKDGYIYVAMYSGKVYKYDTNLQKIGEVAVNANPEQLAISGSKLLCINSGYGAGKTMSVIDLNSFTLSNTITIGSNPQKLLAYDEYAFIIHYDEYYNMLLEKVNINTGDCESLGYASTMAEYNGTLYIANNATDYTSYPYATTRTFYSYDIKNSTLSNESYLKTDNGGNSDNVYCLSVNPTNGDIYVGYSDYSSQGFISRYKNDGSFVEKIDAGGISPSHIVFM